MFLQLQDVPILHTGFLFLSLPHGLGSWRMKFSDAVVLHQIFQELVEF